MNYKDFVKSLSSLEPPKALPPLLEALWYDAKGDWDTAHSIAQEDESRNGSLVHAYLHRKEGDSGNARYWYSSARSKYSEVSLDQEWQEIAIQLLQSNPDKSNY